MPLPKPVGRQKEVLYLPAQGHIAVLGTAGSGKTTLAILRAAYLAARSTDHSGPTLLVTFNRALVTYIRFLASDGLPNVTVEHYHKFARGYLHSRGKMGMSQILGSEERLAYIKSAMMVVAAEDPSHPLFLRPAKFVAEELRWISQHGIKTIDEFQATPPKLPSDLPVASTQSLLWRILEEYRCQRSNAGRHYDWDDVAVAVRDELATDHQARRYRHVVIDEGQDFSPVMIQSLVQAVPPEGSVTFFGDVAQQIYGTRMSWRSAGLNLIGTPWMFQENYRNTKQIAELALALTRMPFYDGTADIVSPSTPKAAGPPPTLVRFGDERKELEFVVNQAMQLSQAGSVAILTADHETRRLFSSRFTAGTFTELKKDMAKWTCSSGLSIGTYHTAKGLEFDSVILPRVDPARFPNPEEVLAFGEQRACADAGRLLYVGITRARQGLILTSTGSPTTLLPSDPRILPVQHL